MFVPISLYFFTRQNHILDMFCMFGKIGFEFIGFCKNRNICNLICPLLLANNVVRATVEHCENRPCQKFCQCKHEVSHRILGLHFMRVIGLKKYQAGIWK